MNVQRIVVEYAFLLVLVVFAALSILALFGVSLLELFSDNTAKMSNAIEISKAN